MFIEVSKNNGKDYLRLMKSNRVKNDKGVKVARNTVIQNIGSLDKYYDGKPDYIERLRKSFRAGQPLIEKLEPYCEKHAPREQYTFRYTQGDPACIGNPKLFSHMLG